MLLNLMNEYIRGLDFEDTRQRPLSNIHIRVQQRAGTKAFTIIEGLASDLDIKKILRALKKTLKTGGSVIKNSKGNEDDLFEIIQLQGDHRIAIKSFLTRYKIWEKDVDPEIKIHGF